MSKYFKLSETACQCECGFDEQHPKLYEILDTLREHFNTPVKITSGNRCEEHNRAEGGARFSQHKYGRAVDIKVKGVEPKRVYEYLDELYPDVYGLGLYWNRIHFDVRANKARWDKT